MYNTVQWNASTCVRPCWIQVSLAEAFILQLFSEGFNNMRTQTCHNREDIHCLRDVLYFSLKSLIIWPAEYSLLPDCSEKTLICFLADSLDNWCESAKRYYGIFRRISWVKAVVHTEFNLQHSFVLVRILKVKTILKIFCKMLCIKRLFINTWNITRFISFHCLFVTCSLVCCTVEWSCSFD